VLTASIFKNPKAEYQKMPSVSKKIPRKAETSYSQFIEFIIVLNIIITYKYVRKLFYNNI